MKNANELLCKTHKLHEKCIKIEDGIGKLKDGRVNPKYKTSQVIMPLLLGFLLRIESMNEFKFRLQEDEFINIFPRMTMLPKIDTIRDTLKVLETQGLKAILHHIVKRAVANKVFDNGTIDGYMVGAIDGAKFFGSNKKFCPGCLKNNKHNFHGGVVISTIGDGPSLTVGFEMYKPGVDCASKDEGELNVAKRLISDVSRTYRNLFDVVVYDALACNYKWIKHCIGLDINVVIRAKENNINSLRGVKRITNKKDCIF